MNPEILSKIVGQSQSFDQYWSEINKVMPIDPKTKEEARVFYEAMKLTQESLAFQKQDNLSDKDAVPLTREKRDALVEALELAEKLFGKNEE